MKITQMLVRENFYAINEHTLKSYYAGKQKRITHLFIYPQLNAIITNHPSINVKNYLYTEFNLDSKLLKKLAIQTYIYACLNSNGLLAKRKITLDTNANNDTLIYPCNKKYRIFHFDTNTVDVIVKDGFPNDCLMHELKFRIVNTADFILPLLNYNQTWYTEHIIDGIPLARVTVNQHEICKKSIKLWEEYNRHTLQQFNVVQYTKKLFAQTAMLIQRLNALNKDINTNKTKQLVDNIFKRINSFGGIIDTVISHGDLQKGNIWIENKTNKIYIIDWESWGRRSVWYDHALLFDNIRRENGISDYYFKNPDLKHSIVLAEDIIFRLTDLCNLPQDYGVETFNFFISTLNI